MAATCEATGPPLTMPRQSRAWNRCFALVVILLVAPPGILFYDTWRAILAGWQPDRSAMVRHGPALFGAMLVAAVLALLISPSRRWLARRSPQVLLMIGSLTLGLLLAEITVRQLYPPAPFHLRHPSTALVLYPDHDAFPGASPIARVDYDAQGVRRPRDSAGRQDRVLCLGGSTTESLFIDEDETWPTRLSQRGAIVNVGHCDLGTGHHLRFLRESRLASEAHTWILLVGASDLMRFLLQVDQGEHPAPTWYDTALASLVREVWNGRLGRGMVVDPTGAAYAHARGKLDYRWSARPDFETAVAGYRRRLREIVDEAHRQRKRLIFVTQPVLWDPDLPATGMLRLVICRMYPHPRPWRFLTPENLRSAIDLHNDTLRNLCREVDTELVDAAADMNGKVEYFYDDYHLTQRGSQRLAELVRPSFTGQ